MRIVGLIVIGCIAIVIAQTPLSPLSTLAYLTMIPIGRYSRHVEARARTRAASAGLAPAPIPATPPPAHP